MFSGHKGLIAIVILLLLSVPARADLTKADVGHINLQVNQSIRPTGDNCNEYARAKLDKLSPLVPANDIKLLAVYDFRHREFHMVVKIKVEGEWLVLDNMTNFLVPLPLMKYQPIKEY